MNNHFYYLKKTDGFLYQRLIIYIYITKMEGKPWRMVQVDGLPNFSDEGGMEVFFRWLSWLRRNNQAVYHLVHVLYGKHDHGYIQCQHEKVVGHDGSRRCTLAAGRAIILKAWNAFAMSS
jgi:hypothetical protein